MIKQSENPEKAQPKKIIFSGVQPTGSPTLGNYLGAFMNWKALQEEYDCIYSVVDMHAITVRQKPAQLRKNSLEMVALLLAVGIDPVKSTLFLQSHVASHAELAWVLNAYTMFGELSRMTQFKDKAKKQAENINAGLFDYPVLMIADILLYQANLVPVGEDQRQHLELTRVVAQRFNGIYGETFVVPEAYIPEVGARVMSLQAPDSKMSKSDSNPKAYILMLDDPDTIIKKFKSAVTDSDACVRFDAENKPGISNLMGIYASVTGLDNEAIQKEFEGVGYGPFKEKVGEVVVETLRPIREQYLDWMNRKDDLKVIYTQGAEKAFYRARRTMDKVYRKIGFVAR
jgi:tryptophanyl-tRNA synthetase